VEAFLKILGIQDNPLIIIAGALCLAFIALAHFSESLLKLIENTEKLSKITLKLFANPNFDRRRFLIRAAYLGATTTAVYVACRFVKIKDVLNFISKPSNDGYLIANKKNGIVHHSKLCMYHLPDKENQVLNFSKIDNIRPHSYRGINLYEIMAKQFLKEGEFEKSVVFFRKAIDLTPERVHLYDHLAKLYGRLKKYDHIEKQYGNGVKKITAMLNTDQNQRQLQKVRKDLKKRIEQIQAKHVSKA